MDNIDAADEAVANTTALANCFLTPLHGYDCGATEGRVQEAINEMYDDLTDPDIVEEDEYYTRMVKAAFTLRDWIKFEHQTKPLIDSGISHLRLTVVVADLKGQAKRYKYPTPIRLLPAVQDLQAKGLVFKIPYGHLAARCMSLEASPIDKTALATGKIELDEDDKVARFEYRVDLRRHILRGRNKFKKAFTAYLKAAFGEDYKQRYEEE